MSNLTQAKRRKVMLWLAKPPLIDVWTVKPKSRIAIDRKALASLRKRCSGLKLALARSDARWKVKLAELEAKWARQLAWSVLNRNW